MKKKIFAFLCAGLIHMAALVVGILIVNFFQKYWSLDEAQTILLPYALPMIIVLTLNLLFNLSDPFAHCVYEDALASFPIAAGLALVIQEHGSSFLVLMIIFTLTHYIPDLMRQHRGRYTVYYYDAISVPLRILITISYIILFSSPYYFHYFLA